MSILIVDPVCADRSGHNVNHLSYVRDFIKSRSGFRSVQVAVAEPFAPADLLPPDFVAVLPMVYPEVQHSIGARDRAARLSNAERLVLLMEAWLGLLRQESGTDLKIVIPGVDYWTIISLARALCDVGHTQIEVHLRFLGILDFHSTGVTDPVSHVAASLAAMEAAGVKAHVAAESPRLASDLAPAFRRPVQCVPSPSTLQGRPVDDRDAGTELDTPYVYLPGTARLDKGLDTAAWIVHAYREKFPDSAVRFVAQQPSSTSNDQTLAAARRFLALPGTTMLGAWLPDDRIRDLLSFAVAALLPYDQDTYRLRSSASLGDAIEVGTPVITPVDTGLEALVNFYGVGLTYDHPVRAAEQIESVFRTGDSWDHRMASARSRFLRDIDRAWGDWLGI